MAATVARLAAAAAAKGQTTSAAAGKPAAAAAAAAAAAVSLRGPRVLPRTLKELTTGAAAQPAGPIAKGVWNEVLPTPEQLQEQIRLADQAIGYEQNADTATAPSAGRK